MRIDIKRPIVGFSSAFTGKYKASKFIIRFLELLNVNIKKSTRTTPDMIEAGTTLASGDFCLPLRVYVGHIYILIKENPEIEYILTPIIKGEHPPSSTCAKYRDLDGVLIRSLGTMLGYRLQQSGLKELNTFEGLIGADHTRRLLHKVKDLPKIIAPEIESLDKSHLRQVGIRVYVELFGLSKAKELLLLASKNLSNSKNNEFRKIERAFKQAYQEVIEQEKNRYQKILSDPTKPRLAIVGRNYLTDDPALSADIKSYFTKKGISVITSEEFPFKDLKEKYEQVNGFYDTHRMGQAFIDTVFDQVDGFVVIGSFGCHPDAFQVDFFAKYIMDKGKACWTFKFDEQTGGAGFHTRYETIIGFLHQKKAERLNEELGSSASPDLLKSKNALDINNITKKPTKPIFIWPHMGSGIDLLINEVWHQLGLSKYLYPPKPVNEETIEKGNVQYTETCSPFALYMGSLRQTLDRIIDDLHEEARSEHKPIEPRRIIILMAKGRGPCTFGWYSIAGESALIEDYSTALEKDGHTLEMIAIDNEGRNLLSFLQELSDVAENDVLNNLIHGLNQLQNKKELNIIQTTKEEIKLIKLLKNIVWSGWNKLLTYEDLQNKALVVRAHEKERGTTTVILRKWINKLEEAHTLPDILKMKQRALVELDSIPQDTEVKPKVVVVGEIYAALTPFANRGTVDNLLGLVGIEAIEGMRLSHFIRGAFKGLKINYIENQPMLKPLLQLLESKGLYNLNQWVREPAAKPFIEHEIGGDGQPTIAHARHHIEDDGVDGILHLYPFKCMPEGMAKDALIEMSQIYGIKSLHLSFDKEIEIERLKTEINTFSTLLHQDIERKRNKEDWKEKEIVKRKKIGKTIEKSYRQSKKTQFRASYFIFSDKV